MRFGLTVFGALILAANVAIAQTAIDITTLERKVDNAQVAFDRSGSSADEREMTEIRDDLGYLRVKARRGETVTSTDRRRLNDRIDRFMVRMNGRTSSTSSAPVIPERPRYGQRTSGTREIPAGSEIDVRLRTSLTSDTAQVEDRVEATTMVDMFNGDVLLVPAGSRLTGYVSSVDRASRTDRKGSLTINFTRLNVNGREHDVTAYVTQALESEGLKGEAGRIGAGAGVGAIIGGILGGVKGAIAGILIGSGGVLVATEGKDVHLPEGTVLRVRFDSPVLLGR
jgi:type IV secretory pathway VirB10-like protein